MDTLFPLTAPLVLGIDPIFMKIGLAEWTPAVVGVTVHITAGVGGFGLYLTWRGVRDELDASIDLNRWTVITSIANTVYLLCYYAALTRTPVVVTPVLVTSTLLPVSDAAVCSSRMGERVTWKLAGAPLVVVSDIVLVVQA